MQPFEKTGSHYVAALQATIEQYVDPKTGARHVHIATDSPELAFLVAFPTVPDVSDGRAHILEHLALSGSQRYPVRAPFFSMMRRSTATFMNAMTYADRTAYPFATTDRQDFLNLLDVYLDASFFPTLDYLDFLQEGWRHVIDGDRLTYQGVVLNEMKGAFADPMRALHQGITTALFKGTTYEVVSGGDPLAIPSLSHAMLREFHASHYHPSQALFMSAGRMDAALVQERIASQVLVRHSGFAPPRQPGLTVPWSAPRGQEVRIPSQRAGADEYGLQIAWLLGETSDQLAYYSAQLLWSGLFGDAAAPLRAAMESAGFGRPSRMNWHDASMRQMVFHVGMDGLTQAQVEDARQLIWTTLERVASEGVSPSVLHAALRDLRYQQRTTESGGTPFILRRMLQALPLALYGGDLLDSFDNERILAQLEARIDDPAFFKSMVRSLLDNPSRLTSRVVPDAAYFADRAATEQQQLAERSQALSAEEKDRIRADNAALAAHQAVPADKSLLPRIRPADVSPYPWPVQPVPFLQDGAYAFPVASNGISYAKVLYDVSHLPASDWPWLKLYAELAPDLGVGEREFAAAGAWRKALVSSFAINLEAMQLPQGRLRIQVAFSASGLREEHASITEALARTIADVRFDEKARLAFLVERLTQNRLQGLANAGNEYAMLAATAPLSPLRAFQNCVGGAPALAFYRALKLLSQSEEGVSQVAARLLAIHAAIVGVTPRRLCIGTGEDGAVLAAALKAQSEGGAATATAATPVGLAPTTSTPAGELAGVALHATSQVNHCVIAWRAPALAHRDAAPLAVAAELMGANLLHQSLRERGGAYGGYARFASDAEVFMMSSYRDPRLAGTYADFSAALDAVVTTDFTQEQLEEAIISVVKGLDKPLSPYAGALHAWQLQEREVTLAMRQQFRDRVLTCTLQDIRVAVHAWLGTANASRAAFAGNADQDLAGLRLVDLAASP